MNQDQYNIIATNMQLIQTQILELEKMQQALAKMLEVVAKSYGMRLDTLETQVFGDPPAETQISDSDATKSGVEL